VSIEGAERVRATMGLDSVRLDSVSRSTSSTAPVASQLAETL